MLLNGPPGIGKTTIGRALAATVRNGVCIHGDELRSFVVAREPGTVPLGLSYAGGAALADVYLGAGYELTVFEYVFERREHVDRFLDALTTDVPVHLLTLWAPLELVAAREAQRPGRERLGDRVATCWRQIAAELPQLGATVDASAPAGAVLAEVCRHVAAGSGRIAAPARSTP